MRSPMKVTVAFEADDSTPATLHRMLDEAITNGTSLSLKLTPRWPQEPNLEPFNPNRR